MTDCYFVTSIELRDQDAVTLEMLSLTNTLEDHQSDKLLLRSLMPGPMDVRASITFYHCLNSMKIQLVGAHCASSPAEVLNDPVGHQWTSEIV